VIRRIFPSDNDAATAARQAWKQGRLALERRGEDRARWRRVASRVLADPVRGHNRLGGIVGVRQLARRSLRLRIRPLDLTFPDLPTAFDGFAILFMSDLHLQHVDGVADAIVAAVAGRRFDLLVFGGDYEAHGLSDLRQMSADIRRILAGVDLTTGAVGILGNHDSAAVLPVLEEAGVVMLVNEIAEIVRGGERLLLAGTDDVHQFHTPRAEATLAAGPDGFRIALIHSVEAADEAAARHRLMLSGHSHGGQLCLPGGFAPVRSLRRHRNLYRGLWEHHGMTGYTTTGIGTSVLPFRFNSPPEIVTIVLRRG
jgi:hypothetical protein